MRKMNNLEYSYMIQELSPLIGKHFGRMRKLGEAIYRIKISDSEILVQLGVRLHKTKYIEESEVSDQFVQRAEKELDNARLIAIRQINNDRIIAVDFDNGSLIFEMFGNGNGVLVKDGTILAACKNESWSDREIKPGITYSPPKNIASEIIEPSDRYIIVSLTKLPLGKEYALEALARLNIDEKTPGNSLSKQQIESLSNEIGKIKVNAAPILFMKDGRPADFSLAPLHAHAALEAKELSSLSEAIDEFYQNLEAPNPKLEKLENRLQKQEERLVLLKEEERQYKEKGDFIYAYYNDIEAILASAKKGEFKEWKVDKKEKSVELEFQ